MAKTPKTPSSMERRNAKSSTTEIVDDDLGFTTLLFKTIGDGGGGRLIDDTEDLEISDSTGMGGSPRE